MDRFRAFFEAALQGANAPSYGLPGAAAGPGYDPEFSRSLPASPYPMFATPPSPFGLPPLTPGGGFEGLGSAPGWGMFSNPAVNSFMAPLSLQAGQTQQRGAASGASAVAAARPSPSQATMPTASGAPSVGTKSTVLRWLPMAKAAADKYGVPVELVLAVMHNESSGDPNAQSPWNPDQGYARGLMQVMPFHFKEGENPFDPATNLDRGVRYLGAMYNQFGKDAEKAMAAYFGGPGAIDSAGNIRRGLSDVNISVGKYLDTKLKPALVAYTAHFQQQGAPGLVEQPAPQAKQGPADLADLWAWLGGSRHQVTGNFGASDGPYPGSGHRGMDIGAPSGTRLVSPIEGVVVAAGDVGGGYGNQVRIKTAYGSVLLGHLASVNVQQGQRVTAGMQLGTTGNTGKSTGPHLHFELRDANDNAVDPARYYRWH